MASNHIKALIHSKMDGWEGDPQDYLELTGGAKEPVNKADLQKWIENSHEFARRVRRDILVLEHLLVAKGLIDEQDLYGDPGDPPPDPDL